MDRVAVFVDAGYLLAEGSRALSGRKLARAGVAFDHAAAISRLKQFAWQRTGLPLLRIYWYDATANRPTRAQIALAEHADVKLRLGRVNSAGQQKGVDALIANDLVALARNRAMTDCVLVSGDDEMRIAVAEVQQLGTRVHLVGIAPIRKTQSPLLRREADSTGEWDAPILGTFMGRRADGGRPRPGAERLVPCRAVGPGAVPSGRSLQARSRALPHSRAPEPVPCGTPARATTRVAPTATCRTRTNSALAHALVRQVLLAEYHLRIGRYPPPCADSPNR